MTKKKKIKYTVYNKCNKTRKAVGFVVKLFFFFKLKKQNKTEKA